MTAPALCTPAIPWEGLPSPGLGILRRSGIKITKGTSVDTTIIAAPSSTKNNDEQRDLEKDRTAKGQQWYFGSAT